MKKRRITININNTLKYIHLWNGIFNLTSREAEILAHFIDVNEIRGSKNICAVDNKKDVAVLVGLKDYNTLNNYIKRLKDKKVMLKQKDGNYKINSFLETDITHIEVIIKNELGS
tara:strand:- start:266 stop:610 length:345 start_codon:yes stop_codon:yes gene_type:complete